MLVSKTSGLVPHGFESHRLRQSLVSVGGYSVHFLVIDRVSCTVLSVTLPVFYVDQDQKEAVLGLVSWLES